MENLRKRSGTAEQASPTEYKRWKRECQAYKTPQKTSIHQSNENAKCKKFLTQNIQKIWKTMKKQNLRIIGIKRVIPISKGQKTSSTKS